MRYQVVIEVEADGAGAAMNKAFDDPGPISVREECIFTGDPHGPAGAVGWKEVLRVDPLTE